MNVLEKITMNTEKKESDAIRQIISDDRVSKSGTNEDGYFIQLKRGFKFGGKHSRAFDYSFELLALNLKEIVDVRKK